MKQLILLMLLFATCLTACDINTNIDTIATEPITEAVEVETEANPFIQVYCEFGTGIEVWVDTTTQVMYMYFDDTYSGAAVMLVNPDGTPRLYQGEFDEE